jgi:hypothetical protein
MYLEKTKTKPKRQVSWNGSSTKEKQIVYADRTMVARHLHAYMLLHPNKSYIA